jgi:hypothetical protein
MRRSFFPVLLLFGLGCAVSPMPVLHQGLEKERFTRVNFRPQNQTLFSANYLANPSSIPLGTPAKITLYSSREVHLTLNDVEYTLYPSKGSAFESQAFPTDDAGIEAFLGKYFVERKEDLKLESLGPPELNEKVLNGLQMIGMTKEQTYACLGPPIQVDNGIPAILLPYDKILASDRWIYPSSWVVLMPSYVDIYFGDGRLQKQVP